MSVESGVKAGRAIMSFIIPPVGIVTYFMIKDERPKNANAYLGIALTAVAFGVTYAIVRAATQPNQRLSKPEIK